MAVLAVVRQRDVANVLWPWTVSRPSFQLFRLNERVRLPMAFPAKGDQVAEVIRSAKPQRQFMVHVQAAFASSWFKSLLEAASAVLAVIAITGSRSCGLLAPVRAGIRTRSRYSAHTHPDRNANRLRKGAAGARTKVRLPNLGSAPSNRLAASSAKQISATYAGIALTFVGAEPRGAITVIGRVRRCAMGAFAAAVLLFLNGPSPLVARKAQAFFAVLTGRTLAVSTSAHSGPFYPKSVEVWA